MMKLDTLKINYEEFEKSIMAIARVKCNLDLISDQEWLKHVLDKKTSNGENVYYGKVMIACPFNTTGYEIKIFKFKYVKESETMFSEDYELDYNEIKLIQEFAGIVSNEKSVLAAIKKNKVDLKENTNIRRIK